MASQARLHTDAVVVDCHNDLVMTCTHTETLGQRATFRHRWVPELRAGGVDVQVVPVATESNNPESSLRSALQYIAAFKREVAANQEDVAECRSGADIDRALTSGKIAMILALEGASCLGNEPSLVRLLYELGVRMISFTHMGRSWLADGSGENAASSRLTRSGVQVLSEMERLGILMDVSHLNETGTEHVLEVATRPVIASHSSARAIYDHHRNLTDEQLRAIAAPGGVIGVNTMPAYIDPANATMDRVVDHIIHMLGVAGEGHVGLGPDFIVEIFDDFYPENVPVVSEGADGRTRMKGLYGSRHLPSLTDSMVRRGLSDEVIRGVLGLNFMRVFRQVMGVPQSSEVPA